MSLPFPDHYTHVKLLARGGMGILYSARDARSGRAVALKTLPDDEPAEDVRARFLREARAIARLSHPFVVSVIEVESAGARPWYAMELVQGDDLGARLARGERPTVREGVRMAVDVADALAHVHRAGVLHRDLKPANVIPLPGGGVKVLDFGLARVDDEDTRITRSGQVLGTPAYMAPEQLESKPVDARTDVYALGSLLYELLAGEPPFTAETCYLKGLKLPRPPSASNPGVTPALDRAVLSALAPMPAERPAGAAAFKAELAAALRELDELEGESGTDPLDDPLSRDLEGLSFAPRRGAALEPGQVREVVALRFELAHAGGLPLERVVCRLAAEVDRHGGRVERYEPGGLVAFFGLDAAGEATPERAVAAGIEIATRTAQIARTAGATAAARVVVDAARVRVRPEHAVDEQQFPALAAPRPLVPSGVWVTPAIARRIERRFLVGAPEGDAQLAQVTGVDALAAEEDRRAARSSSPLVGRRSELARARAFYDSVVQGTTDPEQPAVLAVSGEPGIGKSRLVDELLERIDEEGHPHLRATAAGLVDQPLRLIAVLVRRSLALTESGAPAERAARLAERVDRLRPGRSAAELRAGLGDLLGLPGDRTSARQDRIDAIHRAVATLFSLLGKRALSRLERPQVLVVEDLEEADPLSHAALETVLDRAGRGLFLIVTARPPFTVPSRWRRSARLVEVPLGPLPAREARRLLRAVRGEDVDPEEDDLLERAGGNPLFLEELATLGAGAGTPQLDGRLAGDDDAPVPAAVEAMLLARLARVAPAEREVAEVAAILGSTVDPGLVEEMLRALSGAAPANLWAQLARLVESGVLRALSAGEPERLSFQPPLARDVVLRAMLPSNRRVLHLLAVRVLEEQGTADDAQLERVAHHADASGDRALALDRLRRALDRAAVRPDPAAVHRLADRVLSLLAAAPGHEARRAVFEVLAAREHALELTGARDAQRADLTRMMQLAQELGDDYLRGIALDRLSRFCWWHRGDHRTAQDLSRQALALHERRGDRAGQASALRNLGCSLSVSGQFAEALAHHQRALALYKAERDATGVARTLCSMAINSGELGRVTEAHALVKKALEIEESRGARRGVGMALRVLADLHRSIGDDSRALGAYQRALATDLEIGYRHGEAHGLAGAAAALWNAGCPSEASARAADALAVAMPLEARAVAIDALVILAALCLEHPDLSRGQDPQVHATRARELAGHLATPRLLALSDSWLARVHSSRGDHAKALELSRAAVRALPPDPAGEPRARELLWNHAVIAQAAGNERTAAEALAAALALVDERAARLPDGPIRKSFLERVAINRLIRAGLPAPR